jgi:hypothetical protein
MVGTKRKINDRHEGYNREAAAKREDKDGGRIATEGNASKA